MVCTCAEFGDLEFIRSVISKRIKDSKALKKSLSLVSSHPGKEHKLYVCRSCGQMWQGSRAWNWGNDEYLFKVPGISEEEWLGQVYVQPDELLIFTAVAHDFLTKNDLSQRDVICTRPGCGKPAISQSVNCLRHHFESLQRARVLPAYPEGRWYKPYEIEGIIPSL